MALICISRKKPVTPAIIVVTHMQPLLIVEKYFCSIIEHFWVLRVCTHTKRLQRTAAASPAMLYTSSGASFEKTFSLGVYGVRLTEVHEIALIICKRTLKNRFHFTHTVPCLTLKCVCFLSMCNNWPTHHKELQIFCKIS